MSGILGTGDFLLIVGVQETGFFLVEQGYFHIALWVKNTG